MSKEKIKAFPYEESYNHGGMDLRDYFAARALQGLLTDESISGARKSDVAKWSYEYADAMMEARKK